MHIRRKRCIGQGIWGRAGASVPSLGTPVSPDLHGVTNPEAPQPCALGILWRIHHVGMFDH